MHNLLKSLYGNDEVSAMDVPSSAMKKNFDIRDWRSLGEHTNKKCQGKYIDPRIVQVSASASPWVTSCIYFQMIPVVWALQQNAHLVDQMMQVEPAEYATIFKFEYVDQEGHLVQMRPNGVDIVEQLRKMLGYLNQNKQARPPKSKCKHTSNVANLKSLLIFLAEAKAKAGTLPDASVDDIIEAAVDEMKAAEQGVEGKYRKIQSLQYM